MSGFSVNFLTLAAMIRVRTQLEARFMTHLLFVCVLCLSNSVLEAADRHGLSVGYGSNNNKLRIRERVERMVCHFDCVSLSEAILLAIINFLSLSDESSSPKESRCPILENLPVFEIVFAISIVLYQKCSVCNSSIVL